MYRSGMTEREMEEFVGKVPALFAEGFELGKSVQFVRVCGALRNAHKRAACAFADFDLFVKLVCPHDPFVGVLLVDLRLTRRPAELTMTVKKAVEVAVGDGNGTSDPYCRLRVGKQKPKTTSVQGRTVNPVWNEKFAFAAESMGDQVVIEVWDQDRFRHADTVWCANEYSACTD